MTLGRGATCPCCGYRVLAQAGEYEVCAICWWEDDPVQMTSPLLRGGANVVSLAEAQLYFITAGVSDPRFSTHVRAPDEGDVADPDWRPLDNRRDLGIGPVAHDAADDFELARAGTGAPYWLKA